MLSNLPEDVTPLIGRRRELVEVRDLLVSTRVLTLIGIGGVGKTRLARAVAVDRHRAFPDGTWYVDLDSIEDAQLVEAHVSDVLGHGTGGSDLDSGELAQSLQEKHLLLVLDNCELVIDGAARLVEKISQACPDVRILAASRVPLRAAGDVVYQVPPLWLPPHDCHSAKEFDASDAVRLFVERARRACPDFQLTAGNRAGVVEVVRRLDQLPLAIEVAAAQMNSLSVQQLSSALARHSAMLDWSSPSERHRLQTMRASLNWSAALCSKGERRLWARLSVFRGTFDLDAVEAICGGDRPDDVLDLLQGLADRSVIAREDHGHVVRYSMLGLTRQFGQELLNQHHDDSAGLAERHMSWYFQLVAQAKIEENTGRQQYWLHLLPMEHKNIVRALDAAADDPDRVDAAAEAVCALWRYYWWACGWEREGIYWVDRCTRQLRTPALRARVLLLGSLLAWTCGAHAKATALLADGQVLAEQSNDTLSRALAEHVRGDAALYQGRPQIAVEHFRRALETYEPAATSHRVDTLLMLTLACAAMGDVKAAEAAHRETLGVLPPLEQFQRSYSLLYVGEALRRHGSPDHALTAVRDALRIKIELDDPFGVAWTLDTLAEIACDVGLYPRSAVLLGAASQMWETMNVDRLTRKRLQIREDVTQTRLLATMGSSAFTDLFRRGQRLPYATVLATALDGEPEPAGTLAMPGLLTTRETEIAQLLMRGMTNKQIASKLVIAKRTVDSHVQNILIKLGISSRSQIAALLNECVDQHG